MPLAARAVFLPDLFATSLQERAAQPALDVEIDGRLETFTFGALNERSNRLVKELQARGVQPGDRVALFLPNGVAFLDAFIACLKLGAIVVPVNVLYRERELSHILADAEPRAVITTGELAAHVPPHVPRWIADELGDAALRQDAPLEVVRRSPDWPAAIVYTSGTTGRAKGAVLSHANFAANAGNLVTCWKIPRTIAISPRSRSFTCTASETACAAGSRAGVTCVSSNASTPSARRMVHRMAPDAVFRRADDVLPPARLAA